MNDTNFPPIEVKDEGSTRVLKIGDLTINIIDTGKKLELESQPGILFDFDKFLVRLITMFDSAKAEPLRDALLLFRSQLATNPTAMREFGKLCESCVLVDPQHGVLIERTKWDDYIKMLERIDHHVDPDSADLYVGDADE